MPPVPTEDSFVESLLGLDSLVTPADREWQAKARKVGQTISRTIEDDFESKVFRREYVTELANIGALGMQIQGYGCAGASSISYGLVCYELEAIDSAWRTFVSVQGSLAMHAIAKFGSEDQKHELLPSMAKGDLLGCFGLTEPHGGSDPAAMATTAEFSEGAWVINGYKRWIGLASLSDIAVIWAKSSEGIRGFVVPTDTPGFKVSNIDNKHSLRASVQCQIDLHNVRVPENAILPEGRGLSAPFNCLNEARYGIVWGVMGAAKACLDSGVKYARRRDVFGKPIAAHQLMQQKLSDAFIEYEKGVLLALRIGQLKETGELTPQQVSVGKLNNVREAISVASFMRSIIAGDGITTDFPVMRHMANLESVRTYEGTDEIHTLVIGRALTGESAFR